MATAKKPGRNDPCPCGSGKKYKHCCMRKDRQRRRVQTSSPGQLDQIRYMARQLMPHVPPEQAEELQEMLDQVEDVAAYDAMLGEIEAAGKALEAHRPEFEALMKDGPAAMERAERLFSEKRFTPLRYTAGDVRCAFEAVGYPSRHGDAPTKEDMETLVAAIVYLAGDENDRLHLARQLMMALPEYVADERYLDAWMIQYSAFRMTEAPDESNPFLWAMFTLAFEEWTRQVEEQQQELMQALGIDASELAGMDLDEAEAWVRAQVTDPENQALLEAYYTGHPMLHSQAQAETMALERDAVQLLEREDARHLYLAPEEVRDWIPVLAERLRPLEAQARQAMERGKQPDSEVVQAMGETLVDMAVEMADAIFVPERLKRLVADLRDYRRSLDQAGERQAAAQVHTVLILLDREDVAPGDNMFLAGLCFAALREVLAAMREMSAAHAEPPGEGQQQNEEVPR